MKVSGYNEEVALIMLNALQGTETLERYKQQIRAAVIQEIKTLIDKKENEKCNKASCDDCEMCCEIKALDWLWEQLKEEKK